MPRFLEHVRTTYVPVAGLKFPVNSCPPWWSGGKQVTHVEGLVCASEEPIAMVSNMLDQ